MGQSNSNSKKSKYAKKISVIPHLPEMYVEKEG